ncbi:MAG TPA: ORF6N domain-containing protein [Thermoanaerobacterales bacterium]|nr:ORF6N domain-containing protein [Thermoanaerobacterales bacterium]
MNNLIPIEYEKKRVLTTQQLAEVYETDANNISKNFSNNKDRFVEGRDYYFLQGEELKEFKRLLNDIPEPIKFAPQLYLWTERGASRHCKILDTDRAWQQFDILQETYFRVKEQHIALSQLSPELQMFKRIFDAVANAELKLKEVEGKVHEVGKIATAAQETVQSIKETIIHTDKDWRDWVNSQITKICFKSKDYKEKWNETYRLLEERAKCRLGVRLDNLKERLMQAGARTTEIKNTNYLDVIEEDVRLKEIYTAIIKEMAIKYIA